MEENTNSSFFTFDSPKEQSSYIKVIGVGGGGGNAVNHMFHQGIKGVDFIVCNTDIKALNASPVPNKISLGDLGAGGKPERARKAAIDHTDDIREAISHNTKMLFITAGMGGGTGTGAAPVVAEIAKSIDLESEDTKKILVVAIVTLPFAFEGKKRREQALAGVAELRNYVDSIIVINNDKLRSFGDLDIDEAFDRADDVLLTAAKGIAEIITVTAKVNIDFQDVNTVMEKSGTALMGAGSGKGDDRAIHAIEEATTSVLLDDNDIRGAKNVLLYFSYSSDHKIKMDEIGEITDYISDKTDGSADVIWGAGIDDTLEDELRVTLIATGFEKVQSPNVFTPSDLVINRPVAPPVVKPVVDEPVIIKKDEIKPAAPVNVYEPTPQAAPEPKNVFVLDDECNDNEEREMARQREEVAVLDSMVSDIRLVDTVQPQAAVSSQPRVAPVQQPQPAPRTEPQHHFAPEPAEPVSAFVNDSAVNTAADRIRRIHELLRNNANGADIVLNMTPQELEEGALYEGAHSSAREASSMTMRNNGTIGHNPYVFGPQPD